MSATRARRARLLATQEVELSYSVETDPHAEYNDNIELHDVHNHEHRSRRSIYRISVATMSLAFSIQQLYASPVEIDTLRLSRAL